MSHRNTDGLFRGIVTDNEDPDNKCRIRVSVPEVLDGATGWCEPVLPYAGDGCGLSLVPPVGAVVFVEWPRGDLTAAPVWTGGCYAGGSAPEGTGPNTVILMTPGGHRLEFNDDDQSVRIRAADGALVTLDSSGITIDNGQGATIVMQGPTVDINGGALQVM
jgi:uncharacterized protein involved in type VI secretion and phage assembly